MESVKNSKERVVIFFCWLMLGVIIVMAIINLTATTEQKNQKVSTVPSQSVPTEERIAELEKFLKDTPDNIQALVTLGDLYYDSNQLHDAINVFNKAVKFQPESVHIQNDLGMLYQKTGQYDLAIERFWAALKIDPTHLDSLFRIGLIYRYNKREDKKALQIFEEILSKNPEPRLSKMLAEEIEKIKAENAMN